MTKPVHHALNRRTDRTRRDCRPVDHHDGQAQQMGRVNFCPRPTSTRILGHDPFHAMFAHQFNITFQPEGSAINDNFGLGQWQRPLGWIDQSQQIVVLRGQGKLGQMLSSDGQKNPGRRLGQGGGGGGDVGHAGPVALPRRPFQRHKRNPGQGCRLNRIAAHPGGKGVGGINDMADGFGAQIVGQPCHPAKPANPLGQGLRHGCRRATGIGKHRIDPSRSQCAGQQTGLGRAAQKQDACHG